jgi:hypothetical protein
MGIGTGRYGFVIETPAVLKDGQPHTVRALISGTTRQLRGSPQTLVAGP